MPPDEFARLLEGRGLEEELWLAKNFEVLVKMHSNVQKYRGNCLPEVSTFDMLDDYIKSNPIPPNTDPVGVISRAGHLGIAEAVAEIVFGTNPKAKMRAVWLHGERDSGKSTVVDYLDEILCTQAIFFTGKFVNTQASTKPLMRTQLVTCQELNGEAAFQAENMANMKQMLEGRGGIIRNLFQQWSLKFVGCYFLFCSNRLPDISNPDRLQYKDDWVPMISRCKFVYMKQTYAGSKSFPYSAPVLAHCIKALLDSEESVASQQEAQEEVGLDDLLEPGATLSKPA